MEKIIIRPKDSVERPKKQDRQQLDPKKSLNKLSTGESRNYYLAMRPFNFTPEDRPVFMAHTNTIVSVMAKIIQQYDVETSGRCIRRECRLLQHKMS